MPNRFRSVRMIYLFASFAALTGCAVGGELAPLSERNSQLTQGNVQLNIQAGVTTKAQILNVFGAPNITTRNASGREVWSYQRAGSAAQSASSEQARSVILYGRSQSAAGFESSSRMITLIIKFDANDIVSDFRSRESNF